MKDYYLIQVKALPGPFVGEVIGRSWGSIVQGVEEGNGRAAFGYKVQILCYWLLNIYKLYTST